MKTLQISLTGVAIASVLIFVVFLNGSNFTTATSSLSTSDAEKTIHPAWHETRWPFLMDQWGLGRAFRCAARDCGTEINVYVRAKIGFCNCTTGVADDEEMDRINDVELISAQFAGDTPGNVVTVADMKGRSRLYRVTGDGKKDKVLVVAFSRKCDVMVATAVTSKDAAEPPEALILDFLNDDVITGWAIRDLGA